MSNMFNKEHYTYIPKWMQQKLDSKILQFSGEEWFELAWQEYANIVRTMPMRDIPDPDQFFVRKNGYKNIKKEENELIASDLLDDENSLYSSESLKGKKDAKNFRDTSTLDFKN